mgnify:CR=1 FL=1
MEKSPHPPAVAKKKFHVLVRHSPLAVPEFDMEAADAEEVVKKVRADYPSVQADAITVKEVK